MKGMHVGDALQRYGFSAVVIAAYLFLMPVLFENGVAPEIVPLLLRQAAVLGFAVLGAVLVAVPSGFILSAGSQVALVGYVFAALYGHFGLPAPLAAAACLLLAIPVAGVFQLFVHRLGVPPLLFSFAAIPVLDGFGTLLAPRFGSIVLPSVGLLQGRLLGLYPVTWLYLLVMAGMIVYYRQTTWGRASVALGENPQAVRNSGLPAGSVMFASLLAGSLLVHAGGLFSVLWNQYVAGGYSPTSRNFDVVCALCFGGAPAQGGRVSVPAVSLGVLAVVLVNSLSDITDLPVLNGTLIKGLVIILYLLPTALRMGRTAREA